MQSLLLAPSLRSCLDVRAPEFGENRAAMLEKLAEIDRLQGEAEAGGGPAAHARLAKSGKLPVRERIALALDPDSPFLELSSLAAWDLLNGRLVQPFPATLRTAKTYWIVCPKATSALPKITLFRNWMLTEAADDVARLKKLRAPRPRGK